MIDLSFLTEAEQEAILKVLHRDAELKKAEDERIRQLHDVVEDEDELKYKSGQWFYEAKSKRHRDKIHGADLVRASIRKRKKPATIAELSENNMDKLKKSWVNNVNKDIFIPPELYGVMEELEEEQDHLKPVIVETNQSAKKVSFLSTGNNEGSLKATASPAKQRRNPFDTGDLVEADTDFREVKKQKPEHDNGSGKEGPSNDILPSHILFGVKLPYPESKDVIQISPKAAGSSQKHVGTPPIPKPRTVNLKTKDQPSDGSSSPLKREDSVNGTGRRRGILKRRSSSSSTDSESIRITQNVDFVPPVSPILEVGTKSLPTEQVNESSPNSLEILKQVRFSANVTQNPPSPSPESFSGREIGEFKILEPNFSLNEWDKSAVNDNVSSDDSMPIRYPSSALDSDTWANLSQSVTSQSSLPVVSDSVADKMLLNKNNVESLFEEPEPALSLESQINAYTDPEPVYAVVKKVPKATSPDLQQEFDMEDDHMEPKYLGQRGKNQNVVHGGSPLQFGNSYGGGGKISSETNYRIGKPKEKNIFSNEESTDPEFNKRDQVIKDKLMPETKHGRNYVESADSVLNNQVSKQPDANVTWRRPKILEQNESRRPVSTEGIEEPKIDARSPQDVYRGVSDAKEHTPVKEDLFQGKSKNFPEEPREKSTYKPVTFTDVHGVEKDKPVTHLYSPATQNVTSPNISVNSSSLDHVTYSSEEKGRPYPSPQSANFKIMAFKDRMNESPKDQISNPSQFQSLKSFWNVEDKSKPKPATDLLLSSKNLKDVLSRSRPINDDIQHRNSKEITTDFPILPNSLSEEEQTSQKVASWLAQSPSIYSGEKMYLSEEVVENIPKSVATRKANVDEFSSALKNLRGESSPAPHFTKVEAVETTEDIKTLPKEESDMPDIKGIKLKTTETISPAALNNVENEFSANEVKLDDKKKFEPVAQNTPNSSVNQTTKAFTPLEEQQSVGKTIEMSKDSLNNDSLGWEQQVKEAANDTLPLRYRAHSKNETQRKANSKLESSSEYPQEEEIVQKTLAPSKTAHDEFKIGFERLLEEYESLPVEDIKIHPNVTDHTQEYQRPELNASKNDPDERNLNKSEEIIENTTLPPPKDLHDFFDALSKLQIEASEPLSSIPESTSSTEQHVLYEKPRKEVTSLTDSPVIEVVDGTVDGHRNVSNKDQVDLNGISFNKASSTLKRDTQTPAEDVSMTFNILVEQIKFPVEREAIGSVDEAAERVEKSVVEAREHDDEFHNGLIRLQEEASSPFEGLLEPNISSEHVKQSNSEPEAPVEGSHEHPQEEEMIEKTLAPSKTENDAFKLGFEKLMEENNFPSENVKPSNSELEELEDQPKDTYVTFSRVPHVERFISKKVRTNMEPKESFNVERHGAEDEKESEQVLSDEVSSQRDLSSEPKDLAYPKGRSPHDLYLASHCESLAKNAGPDQSGSYAGNRENVLYKQPEIESPELSKPIFVDSKQGAEDIQPVYDALKRSAIKTVPSKNLEEVPPADPNRGKTGNSKEDLVRSNEHIYDDVPTENSLMESQFSNPEKLKRLSQSVPAFLQDETDGRETDSASESSFHIGRHKKSPSSLTNLSGSSGMASMSSVSGSVMSMYSMDFGNVDIKGNIQFSIDYVEQLREFHVFVAQCKDLAVGDVKKQRSDPYVKSYLLPDKAKMGKRKTAVRKKTLNPSYNEILRYKIDRASLLNQKLNLAVWHNDPLGRNSFLGEVYLDLATWDWNNKQMNWYPLQPRTPAAGIGLENRGETKLALKYVPEAFTGLKSPGTGEVHIWIKECSSLPMLRGNKINSFIKCTILPDTSRKSRQKTRTVDKTPNPVFNHTMVYDGFKTEDLREACAELTVWDHNRLTNHFLGGLRIGLGSGKSYGTAVDWMDSSTDEVAMWEGMMSTPNTWIEAMLPLRMLKMAKLAK